MNKKMFAGVCAVFAILLVGCEGDSGSSSEAYNPNSSTINHTAVNYFSSLTELQCNKVKSLKIFFEHASVGSNLYNGMLDLNNLDGAKYDIPTSQNTVANLKTWYTSNTGWGDYSRGNPGWGAKLSGFVDNIDTSGMGSIVDVAMMKLCYIDNAASFTEYRDAMLSLESAYPSVAFIWWTMPICTEGAADRDAFNNAVRNYCAANNKALFDIADIECHDTSGNKLTDSTGETLCAEYTTDGGHLNDTLNIGRQRLAKAMWVLLSKIAE